MEIFEKLQDYQVEPVKAIIENGKTAIAKETVFFGDSLIQGYDLTSFFPNKRYYNCGVNGATVSLLLHLHDYAINLYKPKNVVLLVGTNDLSDVHQVDLLDIVYNMYKLIEIMNIKYGLETIYLISPLPVSEGKQEGARNNPLLRRLGMEYASLEKEFDNVKYIDVFDKFLENEQLNEAYTTDGLHLNTAGYTKLTEILKNRLP